MCELGKMLSFVIFHAFMTTKATHLSPFVSVSARPSTVHGQGLFADEYIAEGTVLGYLNGNTTQQDGAHTLWLNEHLGFAVVCDFKYINHRQPPNVAYYDDLSVVALVDIQPNEELFHNYGDGFEG